MEKINSLIFQFQGCMQKQSLKKRNQQIIHSVISHTCNLPTEQNLAVYLFLKFQWKLQTSQVHRTHILDLEYWWQDQISLKSVLSFWNGNIITLIYFIDRQIPQISIYFMHQWQKKQQVTFVTRQHN